ncbi:Sec-independent protein translocase protein TatB [Hydrogenovibrio sp. 3SP14C1]|uniref:Sec-independent protein translocase protein TatB n=1 Tax=Hydrogenovibrio sp. 3SP14C1 TaxID=3038774 RepID=UPI002416E4F7|nr:Sec-independent protein translocase protein TatB [Hydrogenovibrio sp. 3SP14C1]MDG4811400.1 Sec-independent protein translocase protein TatB [Hydrogenovibrio sp. 3SP14C1]
MFDIGFLEIIVILVIALIVIGPERMPEVARKIGQFMGKTKRFINSMKENSEITETVRDLQNSMNIEEEKRNLESVSETLQDDFSKIQDEFGIDQEISRPFTSEEPTAFSGTQFNKAPAQPKLPTDEESEIPSTPEESNKTPAKTDKSDASMSSESTPESSSKP